MISFSDFHINKWRITQHINLEHSYVVSGQDLSWPFSQIIVSAGITSAIAKWLHCLLENKKLPDLWFCFFPLVQFSSQSHHEQSMAVFTCCQQVRKYILDDHSQPLTRKRWRPLAISRLPRKSVIPVKLFHSLDNVSALLLMTTLLTEQAIIQLIACVIVVLMFYRY